MKMIDAYASERHYWRHLQPVVAALRAAGHVVRTWTPRESNALWGEPVMPGSQIAHTVLVASWRDAQVFAGKRDVVYLEHGAGQTYLDAENDSEGFPGAHGMEHVKLFLTPRVEVSDEWLTRYPEARAAAIGCPALDQHRPHSKHAAVDEPRRVVITSHWRCGTSPEAWPALPEFYSEVPPLHSYLKCKGVSLVGHAHPRDAARRGRDWGDMGVNYEPDPDVVLRTADLLIADNTSLIYEAAALDIPVLILNSQHYRRDVEHGLRFWSYIPGIQCNSSGALIDTVRIALADVGSALPQVRRNVTEYVYAAVDGGASTRAVAAIEGVIQ